MRIFIGIGTTTIAGLIILASLQRHRPDELIEQRTGDPGEKARHSAPPREAEPTVAESSPISFEEMINGAEVTVTDAELRDWIRANDGSPSAWLAAFGSRFSFSLENKWLISGLNADPENLPLVVFAANAELLTIHANPDTTPRKWLDHFIAVDPNNGLTWFMSALAEYYRGNISRGDEHWIHASKQPAIRLYSHGFEDAGYEFYRTLNVSEAVATAMGDASSPVINIPKLNDTFREILARVNDFRKLGLDDEADALAISSYRISTKMIEMDPADGGFIVIQLVGLSLHKKFVDQVPSGFLSAHAEMEFRVAEFRNRVTAMRDKWSTDHASTEHDFMTWSYLRRNFGELAAVEAFAK